MLGCNLSKRVNEINESRGYVFIILYSHMINIIICDANYCVSYVRC